MGKASTNNREQNLFTLQILKYYTCGNQSARDITEFCSV